MPLPTDYDERKAIPVYDFFVGYFPDALMELVKVSVVGNRQHNGDEPLHWARGKSMDQMNTAQRHMFDHAVDRFDDGGKTRHLAKAAWRLLAQIQLDIEAERALELKMERLVEEQAAPKPAPKVGDVLPSGHTLIGPDVRWYSRTCGCSTCLEMIAVYGERT